jgi:hypothetical protein
MSDEPALMQLMPMLSKRVGMQVWAAVDHVNRVMIVALEEPGPMCNPIFESLPKDGITPEFMARLEFLLAQQALHLRYVTVH